MDDMTPADWDRVLAEREAAPFVDLDLDDPPFPVRSHLFGIAPEHVESDDTPAPFRPILNPAQWADADVPPREWIVRDWLPARQATYITGAGSSGKSLLAQQLATCVAVGAPCLGLETKQATAIYITCEDDGDELHRRQASICEALGIPLADLSGRLHLVSLVGRIGNELVLFDATGSMTTTGAWDSLMATVEATGARFIVLDNVAHLFAGNENFRNQVAAFCGLLNRLASESDAAVLFLGHPNKAGAPYSGSTAWENQIRSRIFLDWPRDGHGEVEDADCRVLSRGKANYARNGDELSFRWHRWAFVRDSDLPADSRAEFAATAQATADNYLFLACLAERTKQRRAVSEKRSPSFAPTVFAKMPESKHIGKARLEAAMDRLFRIGKIDRCELWIGEDRKPVFGLREVAGNGAVNTLREHGEHSDDA